ncbi:MAG: arginase family protein [Labilithrix sp.]|nr:arginase family protein [Labilithrix sp.]MCW5817939.1 arginase family protein [Labilithrix sp.]
MTPLEELALLLRPAGGGLYLVSTGRAEQEAMQRRLYRAGSAAEVDARFRDNLARIATARAIVLGIPSDVGAGFRRGANLGPQAMRSALLDALPELPDRADELGVVDVGDVFVVPQLLHDEMLSEGQKAATRAALYPNVSEALPVSPLSIAERALDLVFSLNPNVAPVILGGDHSTAWPAVSALSRARKDRWGVVQPDAHTDLLEHRLGIKICFATWSWHINEIFGRDGRLVQVGTRASRHDRGHWESGLGVRQFWAEECLRDPAGSLDRLVAHLKEKKVSGVYFSNDIDGTDAKWADATGTPEPGGLEPDFVVELIRRLGSEVGLIGGDVMEVAPPLKEDDKTVQLAVRYLRETLGAICHASL